jgi:hypothetical protein
VDSFLGKNLSYFSKIYPLKLYFEDKIVNITSISRLASLDLHVQHCVSFNHTIHPPHSNPLPPPKKGEIVPKMAQNGRL